MVVIDWGKIWQRAFSKIIFLFFSFKIIEDGEVITSKKEKKIVKEKEKAEESDDESEALKLMTTQEELPQVEGIVDDSRMRTKFTTGGWKNAFQQNSRENDFDPYSPPRSRNRHDSESPPPRSRKRHETDSESPPRSRKRHDSDPESPPRRRRHSSNDNSPPRRYVFCEFRNSKFETQISKLEICYA